MKTAITYSLNKFLRILPLVMMLAQSAIGGTFSTYTKTNGAVAGDLILIDKTNSGAGTFTTRIMDYATFQQSTGTNLNHVEGTDYNVSIVGSTINPTNIYLGSGTLSATSGSQTFTGSANCFVGFVPGYNLVITNDQYTVINVVSSNQVTVAEAASRTYVNTPTWTVYPNGTTHNDINQHHFGWIGNDASFGLIGGFNGGNSGRYFAVQGDHEMNWCVSDNGGGTGYYFLLNGLGAPNNNRGGIFKVSEQADYDSFRLDASGYVSFKHGISNANNTPLPIYPPITTASNVDVGESLGVWGSTNRSAGAGTLSATINTYAWTASSGTPFATSKPGDRIVMTNNLYTIDNVTDSTHATTFEAAVQTYASAAWTNIPACFVNYDSNGKVKSFMDANGNVGIAGVGGGNPPSIRWMNQGHGFTSRIISQAEGWRLEIGGQIQNGGGTLAINENAPYDSLAIKADGTWSGRFTTISNAAGGGIVLMQNTTVPSVTVTNTLTCNQVNATNGLVVSGAANGRVGSLTLNGTTPVVVNNTSITAKTVVMLTLGNPTGTTGVPIWIRSSNVNGTSFSVRSSSATDTSECWYLLTEKQ